MRYYLYLIVLIILSCQSLPQERGSIAKQVNLLVDICDNPNLDLATQERCRKGLISIKHSENLKDITLVNAIQQAKESNQIAFEKTELAGKWIGARTLVILLSFILAVSTGIYFYIKKQIPFL